MITPLGRPPHQGKFRFSSSSHGVATPSEGARQSPRGDKAPPAETLGPLGSAERLNWLKPKKRLRKTRSEEHTSELQSLMRISYAVFCLKKKKKQHTQNTHEV